MKILFDLFPLVVFFGAFRLAKAFPDWTTAIVAASLGAIGGAPEERAELSAVIVATLSAIAATFVQIGYLLARRHPVKPTVWISAALVVIFGGLTVWLHNAWFIKWKPSILYWIFTLILVGGRWIWKRNFLGMLLSTELELPARIWDQLLYAWAGFFLLLGGANLAVAYGATTEVWVNFKTFGLLGLTVLFSVLSGLYMARYLPPAGQPSSDA